VKKRVFSRLILIVFGLGLGLALLEGVLRVWDNPFGYRVKGERIVLPIRRRYTIRNHSNPKLDSIIIHTKNSLGFRGPEPPENLDVFLSIIAVGGSTTEQFNISDGNTWVELLAASLGQHFRPLWVNNAGMVGHSTFGHLVLLQDVIVPLQPDVVLLLVGANELGLVDIGPYDRESLAQPDSLEGAVKWASLHSEVGALAFNFVRYLQTRTLEYDRGYMDLTALPRVELSEAQTSRILAQYQGEPLESYRQRLTRLVVTARANGIEPVLITQPALYGDAIDPTTGVDLATIEFRGKNGATEWAILELYNDITRQVAQQQNVFLIDLAGTMPKDSQYYRDMIHYTNTGSQRVAGILFPALCAYLAEMFPAFLQTPCPATDPAIRSPSGGYSP